LKRDERDGNEGHEPPAKFEKQSQETAPHNVEDETIEVRQRVERHARDYHKTRAGKRKRDAKLKAGLSGEAQHNTSNESVILRPTV
jgi:hypothetical protein